MRRWCSGFEFVESSRVRVVLWGWVSQRGLFELLWLSWELLGAVVRGRVESDAAALVSRCFCSAAMKAVASILARFFVTWSCSSSL